MRRIAFSRCKLRCLQRTVDRGDVGVEGCSPTTHPRPHRQAGARDHVQTRVQSDAIDVLTRFGGDGGAERARMRVLGGREAWAGRFAEENASEGMAKHGGGCSLRRCAKGLALTGYTSATRLAPPVFDPCRSGLARSVTIISQLRSKATKQLIPPQHPIDAFFFLGGKRGHRLA